VRAALALIFGMLALPAVAVTGATMERPLCDPCVPAMVSKSARITAPTRGAELRAQVEAKLRAPFEAAAPGGLLTRAQARAAGLGFIDRHFDAIDGARRGAVTFDDYQRFLDARAAAAAGPRRLQP